jgi:hypothetical protein
MTERSVKVVEEFVHKFTIIAAVMGVGGLLCMVSAVVYTISELRATNR